MPLKYFKHTNRVECELVGFTGRPSRLYMAYEKFRDRSNTDDLKGYLSHKNMTIRTYSYWALIEKLEYGYLEVMDLALKDTSFVFERCGCTNRKEKIATTAYMNYLNKQFDNESIGQSPTLDELSDKTYQLDSLIITHDVEHEELIEIALLNREYSDERILAQIIKFAFVEDLEHAVVYVKKHFQRESFRKQRNRLLEMRSDSFSKKGRALLEELIVK